MKPPLTFAQLTTLALQSMPAHTGSLQDVCAFIEAHFMYHRLNLAALKAGVRHALAQHPHAVRLRGPQHDGHKGGVWTLDNGSNSSSNSNDSTGRGRTAVSTLVAAAVAAKRSTMKRPARAATATSTPSSSLSKTTTKTTLVTTSCSNSDNTSSSYNNTHWESDAVLHDNHVYSGSVGHVWESVISEIGEDALDMDHLDLADIDVVLCSPQSSAASPIVHSGDDSAAGGSSNGHSSFSNGGVGLQAASGSDGSSPLDMCGGMLPEYATPLRKPQQIPMPLQQQIPQQQHPWLFAGSPAALARHVTRPALADDASPLTLSGLFPSLRRNSLLASNGFLPLASSMTELLPLAEMEGSLDDCFDAPMPADWLT